MGNLNKHDDVMELCANFKHFCSMSSHLWIRLHDLKIQQQQQQLNVTSVAYCYYLAFYLLPSVRAANRFSCCGCNLHTFAGGQHVVCVWFFLVYVLSSFNGLHL